ncbi:MAG TPA: 3-hydroxyacyl-ACP dehydratase FabZ [Bacillota bacterium]|jgi:3-hydroxyacyl-[acyl-carrier-protein] dehydratase|nr:3-hydroxyacyl-ACP dehydratase FabZ [Bacillota bacterium]HQC82493.1 3-hydroxyacyl-ACP dehydratase FabZ [Bacillota bacterium]
MKVQDLEKILPHRKPMLLLDEAKVDESGKAIGIYNVKGDEFFLQGHFPGNPVVPGVILCEMMAQTCAVLFSQDVKDKNPYYTSLDKVRFRNPVKPGDRVTFECEIIKAKPPFVFAKGKGFVEGKLCIQGEFSFALI